MSELNHTKRRKIVYIGTICLLSAVLLGFIILYSIVVGKNSEYANSLEQIYQKNYYNLVDSVNNTENKLAKTISSTSVALKAKYLNEVSDNAKMAEVCLNNLPYTIEGLTESLSFINQVGGYTETLAKQLEKGEKLSAKEEQTLEQIYDSVLYMKNSFLDMNTKMFGGYNITNSSIKVKEGFNDFSLDLAKIKEVDVEYPTMIYDGPFSNSVINKTIKALNDKPVDENTAKENLLKLFTNIQEKDIEYKSTETGRFETYNYSINNGNGYAQITQKGGNLLTYSSYKDDRGKNISTENAKAIALDFAKKNGIDNPEVVWFDVLKDNMYINIAPVVNDVVYYPDLVKVKIDLYDGDILGYEASEYYTNHTKRNLSSVKVDKQTAKNNIPKKYSVKFSRLALIPLEYNQEVLCWEFMCTLGQDEYYFYFDAQDGEERNILKVISTKDGNKLM